MTLLIEGRRRMQCCSRLFCGESATDRLLSNPTQEHVLVQRLNCCVEVEPLKDVANFGCECLDAGRQVFAQVVRAGGLGRPSGASCQATTNSRRIVLLFSS